MLQPDPEPQQLSAGAGTLEGYGCFADTEGVTFFCYFVNVIGVSLLTGVCLWAAVALEGYGCFADCEGVGVLPMELFIAQAG